MALGYLPPLPSSPRLLDRPNRINLIHIHGTNEFAGGKSRIERGGGEGTKTRERESRGEREREREGEEGSGGGTVEAGGGGGRRAFAQASRGF